MNWRSKKNNWRNRFRAFKRMKLSPAWGKIQWPLMGAVLVVILFLSYIGFQRHDFIIGQQSSATDLFYRSLQLLVMQSGDVAGPVPWQLDVARFMLPIFAAYAAVQALLAIFKDQLELFRARYMKRHLVLCGLGSRGLQLSSEFLGKGYHVVVIEEDEDNHLLNLVRKQGAIVIIGDATDKNTLIRAGVHRAKYLITVCADDGVNAEIALLARDLIRSHKYLALTAFVHIEDYELCHLLSGWSLTVSGSELFRMEFFNVRERGAQLMLKEFPVDVSEAVGAARQACMVIVGLGKLGKSLVIQAARNRWFSRKRFETPLKIIVIDKSIDNKIEMLHIKYPKLDRVCELEVYQMDIDSPEYAKAVFLFNGGEHCLADIVYVCFDDDTSSLIGALTLHSKIGESKVPIVARMHRDAGLSSLVKTKFKPDSFEDIYLFSFLEKTCSVEAVLGGTHEILARAIHDSYLDQQSEEGITLEINPLAVGWDELPEDFRESNRRQAAHIEVKLNAINCSIQPLGDWEEADFIFSRIELELMAELEHQRWSEERFSQGWSFCTAPKNVRKKTNPYLVGWSELPEEIRERNRDLIRELPAFLARAGFQIYRKFGVN